MTQPPPFLESVSSIVEGSYEGKTTKLIYGVFTTPENAIGGNAICAFKVPKSFHFIVTNTIASTLCHHHHHWQHSPSLPSSSPTSSDGGHPSSSLINHHYHHQPCQMEDILATFDGAFKEQETANSNWLPVRDMKVSRAPLNQKHNAQRQRQKERQRKSQKKPLPARTAILLLTASSLSRVSVPSF